MSGTPERIPVLILSPHSRCNCRCVMCDIWKTTSSSDMSLETLESHLASIDRLGVEWVVFSGGEPLMHPDLFRFCEHLKARRIRMTLLSTGLLLERRALEIVRSIDDVIVSLDGPSAVHDRIRRVPGAFSHLAAGVSALRTLRPDYSVTARTTVQRLNCGSLVETVHAARFLKLNGISFLAADVTSEAFNRAGGWSLPRQSEVALSIEDLSTLRREIEYLIANECGRGFVVESPAKLQAVQRHFEAHLGIEEPVAPRCNAPWVSAVVEVDGTVRPCFFQSPIGKVTPEFSLLQVIKSKEAAAFRDSLDVSSNAICRRCVCSLNWRDATG